MFQFQTGSIKSDTTVSSKSGTPSDSFNSKLVRLKEMYKHNPKLISEGFNSKLVRLKVIIQAVRNAVMAGFNSKLVRLKEHMRKGH